MTSLSKSASGLSTPIRALPSNLASRAAPSVPPASQTYEPLVKEVLRHRLLRVFLSSALFSWALVSSCSGWSQGGVTTLGFFNTLLVPILPSTLAFAASTWVLGVVPVVVLRKSYLTGTSRFLMHSIIYMTCNMFFSDADRGSLSVESVQRGHRQKKYAALLVHFHDIVIVFDLYTCCDNLRL